MSFNRVSPDAGFVHSKIEKGPNGRNLCRWCKTEVPKGRRTFCSEHCIHEHRLRSDPGYVRELVKQRDHGVCAECGADTIENRRLYGARYRKVREKVRERMRSFVKKPTEGIDYVRGDLRVWDRYHGKLTALTNRRMEVWCRRIGISQPDGHLWEADHIVPVSEGGGECGLENYRTLCLRCHKAATKALAARRAAGRRTSRRVE